MSPKGYPHEHPEIAELQGMVTKLTELVKLQGLRIDILEAQVAEPDKSDRVLRAARTPAPRECQRLFRCTLSCLALISGP